MDKLRNASYLVRSLNYKRKNPDGLPHKQTAAYNVFMYIYNQMYDQG